MAQRIKEKWLPFEKSLFCFTGLKFDFREELTKIIEALGGKATGVLSRQVTYLIAMTREGSKIEAAIKLDIPILFPIFVREYSNSVDKSLFRLKQLAALYSVFPLRDKCVSFSGFDDVQLRELKKSVKSLGGSYSETFSSMCDFLITNNPTLDEKIEVEAKGGKIYNTDWLESLKNSPSNAAYANSRLLAGCLFCFSCEFDSKIMDCLRVRLAILGANITTDFNQSKATHYFLAASSPTENERRDAEEIKSGISLVDQTWLDSCIKANAILPALALSQGTIVPLSRNTSVSSASDFWGSMQAQNSSSFIKNTENFKPVFRGKYFSIVGINSEESLTLKKKILERGGEIVDVEMLVSPRFIVLPYRQFELDVAFQNSSTTSLVTAAWVEQCYQDNKLFHPESFCLFLPFYNFDIIPEFASFKFSITGITGFRRAHIYRIIAFLGGSYSDVMSSENTHIICGAFEGPKYNFARKHNKVVVTENWLLAVAEKRNLRDKKVIEAFPRDHNPHAGFPYVPTKIPTEKAVARNHLLFSKKTFASTTYKTASGFSDLSDSSFGDTSKALLRPCADVLKGVVIFFSPSIKLNKADLGFKARFLGAESVENFDKSRITHFIISITKEGASSGDFRKAVAAGIIVVSPAWIEECFESRKRLSELDFSFTPEMSTPISQLAVKSKTKSLLPIKTLPGPKQVTTPSSSKSDEIKLRLEGIFRESFNFKKGSHINQDSLTPDMGEDNVMSIEPTPEKNPGFDTKYNPLLEGEMLSQGFQVVDKELAAREKFKTLGLASQSEGVRVSKSRSLSKMVTRSSCKSIIEDDTPPSDRQSKKYRL